MNYSEPTRTFKAAIDAMTADFLKAIADCDVSQCNRIARIAGAAHRQLVPLMLPVLPLTVKDRGSYSLEGSNTYDGH